MSFYKKPIGRFLDFPVSSVLTIKINGYFWRFFGREATVILDSGKKFQFTKPELDELVMYQKRLDGIRHIYSIIHEQRRLNQPQIGSN